MVLSGPIANEGYKGHVLNMPQDAQGFLDRLPSNVSQLPVLILHRHGAENTHKDFRVYRTKVLSALQWLQQNNQFYKDIIIDHSALQSLPEDGVPPELLTVDVDGDEVENLCDSDSQSSDIHSCLDQQTNPLKTLSSGPL